MLDWQKYHVAAFDRRTVVGESGPMPDPLVIAPVGIPSAEAFGTPTLWETVSFAQNWLRDAYEESLIDGSDRRRHEVLFSVCLVESYLLEWVRDQVLSLDFAKLNEYFPTDVRRGVEQKFKEVTKQLAADRRIKAHQDFGTSVWSEFVEIVRMRDGLTHGAISRPNSAAVPDAAKPSPLPGDFWSLKAGHAFRAAQRLLLAMHKAADLGAPSWLENPDLLVTHLPPSR